MPTTLVVNTGNCRLADLVPAIAWLQSGGVVAYPTDTFYGLAVDPRSARAVDALFDVKGRDPRMAVPLLAASRAQIETCFGPLRDRNARLAEVFWPGPLSLVLDAPAEIAAGVHGGLKTIAVRVPAHPVARFLAEGLGFPVTATSANLSGQPPAATPDALGAILADRRVFVVDAGVTPGGAPSTIVDARDVPVAAVREGAIAWNRVLESLNG